MSPASMFRPALFAAALFATGPALVPAAALAESVDNIFVVDMSDGYGVDTCVATGGACGQAIADAWCRVHDFERAVSFGKVTSDALRISVAAKTAQTTCTGGSCRDTVAITCR
ncbi:hypothetical protein [Ancylobacter defluvii]|uniref:Uncharacterized protein n=1 Tax=Ancylobacter defluvii TaxID=1282440 RepID=A0A9W6K1H6_9HYPH|nr:hypothetical protein [Ancylobacter defluvii]MBS7586685.1 hypothetical protein [Ancylobacter defluvii]GLK85985.1 hypothetical protein GCM10017653_40550 [Ancylobacter defluvii]